MAAVTVAPISVDEVKAGEELRKYAECYFYSFIAVSSHLVQQVKWAKTYSTQVSCVEFSFITIRGAIEGISLHTLSFIGPFVLCAFK